MFFPIAVDVLLFQQCDCGPHPDCYLQTSLLTQVYATPPIPPTTHTHTHTHTHSHTHTHPRTHTPICVPLVLKLRHTLKHMPVTTHTQLRGDISAQLK